MLARSSSDRLPRKVFDDSSCSTVVMPAPPRLRILSALLRLLLMVAGDYLATQVHTTTVAAAADG
jgi:hypothetical protein